MTTKRDISLTLDDYRALSARDWRGMSTPDLGTHMVAYRGAVIEDALKTLPTRPRAQPGDTRDPLKERNTLAALGRLNHDTKQFNPLHPESTTLMRALAKTAPIDKKDKLLCENLANLADQRAQQERRQSREKTDAR